MDPKNARQVADEFISLVRESTSKARKAMGIIIVTHNAEMANLADSIYQLQEGRLRVRKEVIK